jgi:hypothetical protein
VNELGGRDYVTGRMLAVAADSPAVGGDSPAVGGDAFGVSQGAQCACFTGTHAHILTQKRRW